MENWVYNFCTSVNDSIDYLFMYTWFNLDYTMFEQVEA